MKHRVKPTVELAVIGQGYVGLPVAMRAVEVGYDVVGYDLDESRIERLAAGLTYVDDVTDGEVAEALASGRFTPTDSAADLARFDIAVITVPTPLKGRCSRHLLYRGCLGDGGRVRPARLHGDPRVDHLSRAPPKTWWRRSWLQCVRIGRRASTSSSATRRSGSIRGTRPGTSERTPKVVAGVDDESTKAVAEFYRSLVDEVVPVQRHP